MCFLFQVTGEGDHLNQVTARYVEAARAKLDQMDNHLRSRFTPTASEVSRRSVQPSRSVSRSFVDDEFSDNDDERNEKEDSNHYESFAANDKYRYGSQDYIQRTAAQHLARQEFGGTYGAIVYLLIASFGGFYLQTACTKERCQLYLPTKMPNIVDIYVYLDQTYIYYYLGICSWNVSMWFIPIGKRIWMKVIDKERMFVFDAPFTSLTVLVACCVVITQYDDAIFVLMYNHYNNFVAIAIIFSLLMAWWGYRRSLLFTPSYWNSYASSGHVISDYFAGRQINPFWGSWVDLKLVYYRANVLIALLINSYFLYKIIKFADLPFAPEDQVTMPEMLAYAYAHVTYDPYALLVTSLTCFYCLDLIWNEHHLANSFELQYEGFGAYTLLRYALLPVEISMMSKYVFEHPITSMPTWACWLTACLYLAGILLKRRSMKLKYEYRMQPNLPRFNSK